MPALFFAIAAVLAPACETKSRFWPSNRDMRVWLCDEKRSAFYSLIKLGVSLVFFRRWICRQAC